MNFNLVRFGHLLRRDRMIYSKKVGLALLVVFFMTFIAAVMGHNLISLKAGGGVQALFMLYLLILLVGGGFLTSTNLGDLKSIGHRINYIGMPVSSIEKVLAKLLYTLPLYVISISSIFWLAATCYLSIYGEVLSSEALDIADKLINKMPIYFIRFYILGHGIAFFFSFLFNTYASVKGALVSIGFFTIFCLLRSFFMPDLGLGIIENLGQSTWEVIIYISLHPNLFMCFAPIFWIMAYLVFIKKSV